LRSTDKGSSWQRIDVLSGKKRLLDVEFNGDLGYISGEEGTITKTLDKGETWHSQAFDVSQSIHSFCFTSGKTFALQFDNGMPAYGTIITSVDDEHWVIPGDRHKVGSIYFIDSFRGFFGSYAHTSCGCGFGLWIYSTDDGGMTWSENDMSDTYGGISEESSFSFSDDGSVGYFLCGQILLRTPYTGEFVPVGIKNQAASKTILNQTDNILHASNSIKEISSIRIASISGKLYAKASGSTVDVSAMPRGMYLVEISFADDTTEAQKWIKK
jgi:photosystem II stability/assembly factor-like uncharacterized protein